MKAEIEIYYPYQDCLAVKFDGHEYGGFENVSQAVRFAVQRLAEKAIQEFPVSSCCKMELRIIK